MLSLFLVRLTFGLLASLLLLLPFSLNPRFFRTHFLTALGLAAGAAFLLFRDGMTAAGIATIGVVIVCFFGSISWSLDRAPRGRSLIVAGSVVSALALGLLSLQRGSGFSWLLLMDDFTAAAFVGAATTAMLLGHSYLIAPSMSIKPLQTMLIVLAISIASRMAVALFGLWLWTATGAASNLENDVVIWLLVRWVIGILLPLGLGWMAWETARIRSTQSATGILYVIVILCFLGELSSLLLFSKTGLPL